MARLPSDLIGPASSTGSPITFMMRPSVPAPTGTMIGLPVSPTSWPRPRPSAVSIAMVRTVDSPRCCATSSTRRLPPFWVSSALRIAGRCPSNCTSTTAPMTCVMRPVWLAGVAMKTLSLKSENLNDGQLDRNISLGCLRVRANRVGFLDQLLQLVLVGAGDRNLELDGEAEAAVLLIQRDFAGHPRRLAVEAVFLRNQHDGLAVAGRITQREQLLGIMSVAGAADFLWRGHGERKRAIVQHRAAVAAALGGRGCHISHGVPPVAMPLRAPRRRR